MSLAIIIESVVAGGAGVGVLGLAIAQSLSLKLSDKLQPGDIVLHTQDSSEPYWVVDHVWFYGLRLSGPNGRTKHMKVSDYRLLNNVSGPVWAEVEFAIPANDFGYTSLVSLEKLVRDSVIEFAKDYLTTTEPEAIAILLDNIETANTFTVKFEIQSYTDKRFVESLVRRALLQHFIHFADRAVLAASVTVEAGSRSAIGWQGGSGQ